MSSDRIERKRRSEFDTSDNSADERPAVKVRRLNSIGKTVSEACKNFLNWVTPNFFKNMASRISRQTSSNSLRMGAENNCRNQYSDDDDEEEISVIGMQNGTGEHSRSTTTVGMGPRCRSTKISRSSICPLSSTPCSFPLSSSDANKVSRAMERRKVNGFPSMTDAGREDISRPRGRETCIAPITNPRSDIDILLEKDNKIEISEVFPAKHLSGPTTRKVRLSSSTRSFKNERNGCGGDFAYNGTISPCASRSPYLSRSTADVVVRLHEREQYRVLLDKVVKKAPLFLPSFPRKDNEVSALQIDLTEDDVPGTNCHFKKEIVEENVKDFLSKYYKPCALVSSHTAKMESALNHTQSMSENDESIFDDDILILDEYPELPKLKPRKPSRPPTDGLFSDAWITELKTTISSSTEKRLQNLFEEERKVERFKKRREARNAEEMRKREEQRVAGIIFEEDIEMEEEIFPEITPEMDAIIEAALTAPLPLDKKMCVVTTWRGEEVDVTKSGLHTLCSLNWLNDQVVNFYMVLIERRSKLEGYPSLQVYSSFFYTKLKVTGPSQLLRWTRRIDIFSKDLIIVPLHLDMHWALLAVDNRSKTVTYYDSMGSGESHCLKIMENYFIAEMRDKKKTIVDLDTYDFKIAEDIPKQMNGSDCGMFTLKYAEYLTRDAPFTFSQENMPYFRRRMIYELLTKQIL